MIIAVLWSRRLGRWKVACVMHLVCGMLSLTSSTEIVVVLCSCCLQRRLMCARVGISSECTDHLLRAVSRRLVCALLEASSLRLPQTAWFPSRHGHANISNSAAMDRHRKRYSHHSDWSFIRSRLEDTQRVHAGSLITQGPRRT